MSDKKPTNTHSEYVMLIAFPTQQWLHERASVLRYTSTAWLVVINKTQCVYCAVRPGLSYYGNLKHVFILYLLLPKGRAGEA